MKLSALIRETWFGSEQQLIQSFTADQSAENNFWVLSLELDIYVTGSA